MSNKGGRVSPDYLADIAPEYAVIFICLKRMNLMKEHHADNRVCCFMRDCLKPWLVPCKEIKPADYEICQHAVEHPLV